MNLGIPGRVVSIEGVVAIVDFWGTPEEVRLDVLEEPLLPGDYVIAHEGVAVRRIPPQDVDDTLAMYEIVLCEA